MRELSIVFPSYNEAERLPDTLARVSRFCREKLDRYELIVVDDGSADDTETVVREFSDVRYLRNEVNRGKGETVKRGMLEAELDTVLFSDVDLSTPIEEALALLDALDGGADVAIGKTVGMFSQSHRFSFGRNSFNLRLFTHKHCRKLVKERGGLKPEVLE